MANKWAFSHPALQASNIKNTDDAGLAASAPPDSHWAADLTATVRSFFAQQVRRYPGRVMNVACTATQDSSGALTVTLVAS